MIVLITGASHTGKTLRAQKLLEQYKYPYLSIDHLKMGRIRSGNTTLTPADDAEPGTCLWPSVREMVKTTIENHQSLVIEGCYIPFDWQKDFDEACGFVESHRIKGFFTDNYDHPIIECGVKLADMVYLKKEPG